MLIPHQPCLYLPHCIKLKDERFIDSVRASSISLFSPPCHGEISQKGGVWKLWMSIVKCCAGLSNDLFSPKTASARARQRTFLFPFCLSDSDATATNKVVMSFQGHNSGIKSGRGYFYATSNTSVETDQLAIISVFHLVAFLYFLANELAVNATECAEQLG